MNILTLASWLFLVAVVLWIVLAWCGVAKDPSELLCFFAVMQFLALHSVPPLPRRAA